MSKLAAVVFSTFFYIGYLPFIPGTFGSLAGLAIYLAAGGIRWAYVSWCFLFLALGFLVSGRAEQVFGKKDAKQIVIDEVAGMFVSLLFLPYDLRIITAAFVIFRILDIFKPYPARQLQRLRGGPGIMVDDIIAGIYTNLLLQIFLKATSFKAS